MAETGEAGIELHLLTLDEYNQLAKTSASLQPGEILFHSNQGVTGIPELQAGSSGPTYVVREELRTFPTQPNNEHVQDLIYTVVLADASAASVLSAALLGPEAAEPAGSLASVICSIYPETATPLTRLRKKHRFSSGTRLITEQPKAASDRQRTGSGCSAGFYSSDLHRRHVPDGDRTDHLL
jgi:hypothetical protein